MKKRTLKLLSALAASAGLAAPSVFAEDANNPMSGAMFAAKGSETTKITVGGYVKTNYGWTDVKNRVPADCDPSSSSNFYLKNVRLSVNADFSEGWSTHMTTDFAGLTSSCKDDSSDFGRGGNLNQKMALDKAYIQKIWEDIVFRLGYQKVNWVAEENVPDAELKTTQRSVATNFFVNLGRRVGFNASTVSGQGVTPSVRFDELSSGLARSALVGERFGGRHAGVFAAGEYNNFHYSASVTNSYWGVEKASYGRNNRFAYHLGLAYEFTAFEADFLLGVNGGWSEKGTNSPVVSTTDSTAFVTDAGRRRSVWGFNPYMMMSYKGFNLLAEYMYGHVENGRLTDASPAGVTGRARPTGFNVVPSYMFTDNLELVARFSYLDTNKMGTTIDNAYGCTPDRIANTAGTDTAYHLAQGRVFEKAASWYLGANYYMLNRAVKASLGYENVTFKNRATGDVGSVSFNDAGTTTADLNHRGARVHNVQASVQVVF